MTSKCFFNLFLNLAQESNRVAWVRSKRT